MVEWSDGPVAQRTEHRSSEPGVAGSSPAGPAPSVPEREQWQQLVTYVVDVLRVYPGVQALVRPRQFQYVDSVPEGDRQLAGVAVGVMLFDRGPRERDSDSSLTEDVRQALARQVPGQ